MTSKEILEMTNNLHLLYLEDDVDMREMSVDLFRNFFTKITIAVDGLDGLQKYETGSFDIIVTDVSMPRMNGLEFIKKVREHNKNIPIIVYSAWNDSSYMAECISMNVDGYLLKPMQIKNLIEVLEKISMMLQYSSKRK